MAKKKGSVASMTLRSAGSLGGYERYAAGPQHPQSTRNANAKNHGSLQRISNRVIDLSEGHDDGAMTMGMPANLNKTLQHGKREQCDFADTDEFYNSLIEKANKKNVYSLNFQEI